MSWKQYPDLKVEYNRPNGAGSTVERGHGDRSAFKEHLTTHSCDEGILDNFDTDENRSDLCDINGVPAKVLKDPKVVLQSVNSGRRLSKQIAVAAALKLLAP